MGSGRRRKKAARQQSVAQWRATGTVVPQQTTDHQTFDATDSFATPANEPVAQPGTVGEPVAAPPDAADQLVAAHLGDDLDDYRQDHQYDEDPVDGDQEGYEEEGPHRGTGRRRLIAVAVAAPLMFAGAFVAGGWIINEVQDQPPRAGPAAVLPPPTPSPSVPVVPPRSGSGTFVPDTGVGPGVTEPGALVRATPTADGVLEVIERVRFAKPVSELSLGPPLTRGVTVRSLPSDVAIADLQVQANDAVVDVGLRALTKARTVDVPDDTSTVLMRYRLTGATVRSIPSIPGRALTLLPPITSPASLGSMPIVIEVSGAEVTNMLCPGLPAKVQLCGRTWKLGWFSLPQQPGRTAVLAQLNLPEPISS